MCVVWKESVVLTQYILELFKSTGIFVCTTVRISNDMPSNYKFSFFFSIGYMRLFALLFLNYHIFLFIQPKYIGLLNVRDSFTLYSIYLVRKRPNVSFLFPSFSINFSFSCDRYSVCVWKWFFNIFFYSLHRSFNFRSL